MDTILSNEQIKQHRHDIKAKQQAKRKQDKNYRNHLMENDEDDYLLGNLADKRWAENGY